MSYKCLILAVAMASSIGLAAENPTDSIPIINQISSGGVITVEMPTGMASRLAPAEQVETPTESEQQATTTTQATTRTGYRVQVYDDNNPRTAKNGAQARKRLVAGRFPEWRTYIQFNSPYWRVKVGDFRTRSEAESAMASIKAAIPSIASQLRVVRDRINIQ